MKKKTLGGLHCITKNHLNKTILINFVFLSVRSGAGFGGAAGLALLYYTDWKLVLQYVPIYGSKFEKSD